MLIPKTVLIMPVVHSSVLDIPSIPVQLYVIYLGSCSVLLQSKRDVRAFPGNRHSSKFRSHEELILLTIRLKGNIHITYPRPLDSYCSLLMSNSFDRRGHNPLFDVFSIVGSIRRILPPTLPLLTSFVRFAPRGLSIHTTLTSSPSTHSHHCNAKPTVKQYPTQTFTPKSTTLIQTLSSTAIMSSGDHVDGVPDQNSHLNQAEGGDPILHEGVRRSPTSPLFFPSPHPLPITQIAYES